MKAIVTTCSAVYEGRGSTMLGRSKRVLIIKDDGAVSLHSGSGNKPLNYMAAPNVLTVTENADGETVMTFDKSNEVLRVTLHDQHITLDEDLDPVEPGLVRDGTEGHLQAHLADHPELFGSGYTLVSREAQTGAGPADILFQHDDGHLLVVEVKRVAMLGAVGQVVRYVEALREMHEGTEVRGVVAALDIRPKTLRQAEKKGIDTLVVERP